MKKFPTSCQSKQNKSLQNVSLCCQLFGWKIAQQRSSLKLFWNVISVFRPGDGDGETRRQIKVRLAGSQLYLDDVKTLLFTIYNNTTRKRQIEREGMFCFHTKLASHTKLLQDFWNWPTKTLKMRLIKNIPIFPLFFFGEYEMKRRKLSRHTDKESISPETF